MVIGWIMPFLLASSTLDPGRDPRVALRSMVISLRPGQRMAVELSPCDSWQ